jgi:hypothetical protein
MAPQPRTKSSMAAVHASSRSSNPSDSTIGTTINKVYQIGSFIGEGAFGKVYALDRTDSYTDTTTLWACKVVVLPVTATTAGTTKNKKANAAMTAAADRLYYEHLVYTQHFRHLCGTIIPSIPSCKDKQNHNLQHYYHNVNGTL